MPRMADRIRNLTLTVANILMIVSVGIEFGCTTNTAPPCPSTTRLPATTITRAKSTTTKLSTRTISNTSTSISTTTTSKPPTSSTISITNTTTPRSASTSSAATTAGSTTVTTTTNTASSTSRSTTQSESDIEGGLSDGGNIGIGVGIGVGGTLALVGILFIVLCRRYDWTKRAKTEGKTDDSDRNKRDISETSHYQQLQSLSMNPVPTYEQLTPPTDVDSTEQSLSDRPTYEHLGHKLKANEPHSTEYEDIQQRELPAFGVYESIKQMS